MAAAPASPRFAPVSPVRLTSWTVRSVVAGAAGTATMTCAYAAERRLRRGVSGALDYDDSLVPGLDRRFRDASAACDRPRGPGPRPAAALELRLGVRPMARRAAPDGPRALGERRLRRHAHDRDIDAVPAARPHPAALAVAADVMATSVGTHVAYVSAVAAVDDGLRRLTK